jgi:MFS family permease
MQAYFKFLRKNRNFRFLYLGQGVSLLGTMITGVAVPYQIYQKTHSSFMVGLVSLIQLLPLLLTALLGGYFADRYRRKKILLIMEVILASGSLLLALNAYLANTSVWYIFAIAFFMSAAYGLHRPAGEGLVQQSADKNDFGLVAGLSGVLFGAGLIVGPALAGMILAHLGITITYLADFFSYVFSFAMLLMIQEPKAFTKEDNLNVIASLRQGFQYAFSRQELIGTYAVDFLAMIFGMPMALFPAIAHLHGGPQILGLLYATPAIGAILVSGYSGWTNVIKRQGVAIAVAASVWGLGIIMFGILLKFNFWTALIFLAIAGGADAVSGIFRSTLWNQTIPTEFRGRLSGIEMISYLSGPKLGDTEAGIVASIFGLLTSIISGGILCVIGVGVCCLFLPKFWHYRAE